MPDRLLLDAMLGTTATYLRLCGHDAAFVSDDASDDEIRRRARASTRTLLTRDVDLAARTDDAVLLSSRDVREQLRELREAGYALSLADPPVRCGACNGGLAPVAADESVPSYAPDPAGTDCWRCQACGRVFWKGSHWDDVAGTLEDL